MKKEEYIKKRNAINEQIRSLEKEHDSVLSKYIESNKPFNIGDKIEVLTQKLTIKYGYVVGFKLDHNSNVIPVLSRTKIMSSYLYVDYTFDKLTKF